MGVACNGCGHENRLVASYCGKCARPLTGRVDCPRCASHNPTVQNYCNSCGSPLVGTKGKRTASLVAAAKSTLSGKPVWASSVPSASGDRKKSADAAKIATVVIIGAILVVTRLWGLDSTPSEMTLAEEAFLQVARQIEFEGWIGLSHEAINGALTGYAYVLSFWTNFIGDDIGMARLLSGVASLASIGVSYLLVSLLFNRRVALFATFLMAVGVWPLTYARLALPTSVLLLVEVTALYLLLRAMHEETEDSTRTRLLVFSGALIGLGLYLDFAVIVFAVAAFCLWLRFYAASALSPRVLGERFAAFALAALIISLPFFAVAAADSSIRDDAKAILVTETPGYAQSEGVMGKLRTVTGNVANTGRALIWSTSAHEFGQGGGRIVDPLTGLLVLIGLLVCLRKWREDSCGALLAVLVVVLVGVGLTRQEGMFGRLIIVVPVVFTLAGFAADWLLSWLKGRIPDTATIAFIALLAAVVIFSNLSAYYAHPIGEDPTLWLGSVIQDPSPQLAVAENAP
ncbi:MAG: phospholipid carrier-dependent glycosyltransferase [Dehalococcoidia bacterium]|nr:phospholipid carrier-dependent glycosyltransferase [Dehalococcoidia bacterium]